MNFNPALIVPELFQFLLILALFLQSLNDGARGPRVEKWVPTVAALGIVATLASFSASGMMFHDVYRIDGLSQFFKLVIAVCFFVTTLNASHQPTLAEDRRADYYLFLAISAWALMLLSSTVELFSIYLALELSSYSLYTVISLRAKEKGAAEAGIKYIVFGAVATAVALYGLSYVLATQHSTYIVDLATKSWAWADAPLAVVGLSLFLAGMFFKLALFPFHFWCPDVYQGTSNETATFVATLPKLGAVVILVRLATFLTPGLEITTILAWLGAISMTLGNLCALAQTDVKRILGFSSVAHAGYVMVGLVSGTAEGLAAATFYALAYVAMNLLAFWVVSRVASDGRNLHLNDLNGLYKRAPLLAFALGVGAFALVGLPPTVGFIGKLFLITAAWNHGYNWLVVTLAINSAFAIYYYLSLVRHAYTEETVSADAAVPDTSAFSLVGAGVLSVMVLALGLLPSPVFEYAITAGRGLFH
ncbi:MAG TPA: NADH-quinone oxidoreductase subunit N [Telmatospirillum sp.]|nr:NADH-quinone oxidoreductase subunit N [Telmatospirillum sp.]